MSLIQDALKRQEEANRQSATSAGNPSPPDPAAEPTVAQTIPVPEKAPAVTLAAENTQPNRRNIGLLVTGLIVFAVVVFVALGYLVAVPFLLKSVRSSKAFKTVATASAVSASKPATTPATLPAPVVSAPLSAKPPSETIAPAPATPAVETKPTPMAPVVETKPAPVAPTAPVAESTAPSVVAPAAEKPPAPVAAMVAVPLSEKPQVSPPAAAPKIWPVLKLSAVLCGAGRMESAARINDRLVPVDSQIDGVTVAKVEADCVLLKLGEESRILKVGETLY